MDTRNLAEFGNDIDALALRIAERVQALKKADKFSDAHAITERQLRDRERKLRFRVEDAIRSGDTWEMVRAELSRDYSAIFDSVIRFEKDIDLQYEKTARAAARHVPPR